MKRFVIALVLLAACGNGGSTSTSSARPATASGLKESAQAATEAFLHDDIAAMYRALDADCRKRVSYSQWAGNVMIGKAMFESFLKLKASDLKVATVDVRNVGATAGEVRVNLIDKTQPDLSLGDASWDKWVYESGGWHSTNCELMGEQTTTVP